MDVELERGTQDMKVSGTQGKRTPATGSSATRAVVTPSSRGQQSIPLLAGPWEPTETGEGLTPLCPRGAPLRWVPPLLSWTTSSLYLSWASAFLFVLFIYMGLGITLPL